MATGVADETWATLLPDLLLDIFRRLETTAVIRCACACKPWRRAIISNASSLRLCPDRFNPNLLQGFFHYSWDEESMQVVVSVTAVDTGHCEKLSSVIPAASAGGVDLSSSHRILSSRDGFLLLLLRFRGSNNRELCLCNPMAKDCTLLPLAPIMEQCEYTLLTGHDLSPPGSTDDRGAVRILAMARMYMCTNDRLTYQVLSCGGDGAGMIWGPVQRSDEVAKGRWMLTYYSRNAVVGHDAVYWLAGPQFTGRRATCTVGLDIYTGRAWATRLPSQCQFFYAKTTPYALTLTTSGNGRLSLLHHQQDRHIKVWVLNDAIEWTVKHNIYLRDEIMGPHSNMVCLRSGFLFSQQLRINLDSRARTPVRCISQKDRSGYYPYEMDWLTYISNMKNF